MTNLSCDINSSIIPFNFIALQNVTTFLAENCSGHYLLAPTIPPSLTLHGCQILTGQHNSANSWERYAGADIWDRIQTWKLPLLQLIFLFVRPPFGVSVDFFIFLSLLGDPVDTIASLIWALGRCRERATLFKNSRSPQEWKSLALLATSFDEFGRPGVAEKLQAIRQHCVNHPKNIRSVQTMLCIHEKGNALAADRHTSFLPVGFAQVTFIGGWVLAFIGASSAPVGAGNWINIQAHSIAFSSQFFFVITAVLLSSLIGASQSELAIPRILNRFLRDMRTIEEYHVEMEPVTALETEVPRLGAVTPIDPTTKERIESGGLYSWQANRWQAWSNGMSRQNPILQLLIAVIIVISGTGVAIAISLRVPPYSWCRPASQLVMLGVWLLSFVIGQLINRLFSRMRYLLIFVKNAVSTALSICIILVTQWGVLNRCSCYVSQGGLGIVLPQVPHIAKILEDRIRSEWRWVIGMGITFQLVVCIMLAWDNKDALRVYLQRDDGLSNLDLAGRRRGTRRGSEWAINADVEDGRNP